MTPTDEAQVDGVDVGMLARRLRGEVADVLTDQRRDQEAAGRPWMAAADERMLGRRLINQALERDATRRLSQGLAPLPVEVEARVSQIVQDALFGLGALERLLADDQVENVNANGCDEVWITYADGSKQRGPATADSDAELIETIRAAAARAGLSERRFDVGRPALNLELSDGSQLFAVMAVTVRPAVSIRRHRYPKVTLDDLVGLGMLDEPLAGLLAAAVRARKNMIVCGGTGAGKTTLLRALLNEVPPVERLVTIEDNFELGLQRHPDLHPDVVAMEAREPNVEGQGEVSMTELVRR
jgi:pilus assembly protein CpaF